MHVFLIVQITSMGQPVQHATLIALHALVHKISNAILVDLTLRQLSHIGNIFMPKLCAHIVEIPTSSMQ